MKVAMIGLRGVVEGLGGVEKAVANIATRLVKKGVEVTCYCRPKYNDRSELDGVRLINSKTIYSKYLETACYALESFREAVRADYDIIHIHALASSALSWLPKISGKKIVITIHGLDWQRAKWGNIARTILRVCEKCALKFGDEIICVSKSLELYFRTRYIDKSIHYIPNGCDFTLPNKHLKPPIGLESKKYFLFMARLVPEKGAHRLIEAYNESASDFPLIIAGPDSYQDAYVQKLKTLSKGNPNIRFPGVLVGEEKEKYLSHAAVFFLPSEIEGLPLAALEAGSRGVSLALSRLPTSIEVLGDENLARGFLFNPMHIKEITTVIDICSQAPEVTERLGLSLKEYVQDHFDWNNITDKTLAVYNKVLK